MYGMDHGEGWEWVTDGLKKMLTDHELFRRAAYDVATRHQGDLAAFWLAKFLYEALYVREVPFLMYERIGPCTPGLTPPNFEHADFEALRLFIIETEEGNV